MLAHGLWVHKLGHRFIGLIVLSMLLIYLLGACSTKLPILVVKLIYSQLVLCLNLDGMHDLFESASIVEQTDGEKEKAKTIDEGYDTHKSINYGRIFNLPVISNSLIRQEVREHGYKVGQVCQ